jgi:outer membrane receptor for monomeric catechols
MYVCMHVRMHVCLYVCHVYECVTLDRVLDWIWGLLTTYTYDSELRTSNYSATDNLHTLHMTTAHAKSSQSAFTSRFLVTDLNNGDSSVSVVKLLPDR